MKREKTMSHRYSQKTRTLAIVGSSVLGVLGVACLVVAILLSTVLGRINFSQNNANYDPNADIGEDPNDKQTEIVVDPSYNPADYSNASSVMELPLHGDEGGVRNFLLLGIDGETFKGRSDTTMILSVNDQKKTIKLVSILRDTWVTIPGRDKDGDGKDDYAKMNAAYAYGGHALQNKMLQQNFRLDIDNYIGVNFKVLPIVIDAMGGLDIELTAKEMTQIPADNCKIAIPVPGRLNSDSQHGFTHLKGEAGVHHLNGFQALQYARIRKIDSDFARTARQRKVVSLMIEKAKKMSYSQLITVLYKALAYVDTNMSSDDLIEFAADAVTYSSYSLDMGYHLPENGDYVGRTINGGAGLWLNDPKGSVQKLHEFIYG